MRRVPDQTLFAWEDIYLDLDLDIDQDLAQHSPLQHATDLPSLTLEALSGSSLLPSSLEAFTNGSRIRAAPRNDVLRCLRLPHLPITQFISTPYGIRTQLPVI